VQIEYERMTTKLAEHCRELLARGQLPEMPHVDKDFAGCETARSKLGILLIAGIKVARLKRA